MIAYELFIRWEGLGEPYFKYQSVPGGIIKMGKISPLGKFTPMVIGYARFDKSDLRPIIEFPSQVSFSQDDYDISAFLKIVGTGQNTWKGAEQNIWKVLQGLHARGLQTGGYTLFEASPSKEIGALEFKSLRPSQEKIDIKMEDIVVRGPLIYFKAKHSDAETAQKFVEHRKYAESFARNLWRGKKLKMPREPNSMLRLSDTLHFGEDDYILVAGGFLRE